MYKTILFDLDDTLIDFQGSQHKSLARLHAEFYSDIDYALFENTYKPINRALWERVGSTENPIRPNDIKAVRFIEIHKKLKIDREPAAISEIYEELLGETAEWLPRVKSVVEFLHHKGHKMGIVTNGLHKAQYRKYELLELKKWFHAFIVSDTVGIAKPHKQIFDLALSEMFPTPAPPARDSILMVGDSLSHDGHGAKNAGIHFCFVSGQHDLIPELKSKLESESESESKNIPVKYHLNSVAELPFVLGYHEEYQEFLISRVIQ
jgi:2-haloacid dehalogenase